MKCNVLTIHNKQIVQYPIHSWGLAAISHRSGRGNRYVHHTTGGFGVVVFVLDTGIRITHNDFGGRAKWGQNFIRGSRNNDVHGHGTHVAGTIAGRLHGVAKRATVVAVKVLSDQGPGPSAGVIAGLQWAVRNAPPGGRSSMSPSSTTPFCSVLTHFLYSCKHESWGQRLPGLQPSY